MFPAFPEAAIAIAVLLSAIVRMIRSGATWQAVDDGMATAETLREITGIRGWDRLQEAFGPPRMDGVWPVTRVDVRRQRTGIGYLMGDKWLDLASMLMALVCLFPVWPIWTAGALLQAGLWLAGFYQLAGWVATMGLMGRR